MKVPNPPSTPLVIFDGDCGFCRSWVARWRRRSGEEVVYEPLQLAAARFPAIPRAQFRQALHLILPSGEVYRGAEAVLQTLSRSRQGATYRHWLQIYEQAPGAAALFEFGYAWIADHRPLLSRLTTFFVGPLPDVHGELGPTAAAEFAAARRRRLAVAGGVGAVLMLGAAAWHLKRRRS